MLKTNKTNQQQQLKMGKLLIGRYGIDNIYLIRMHSKLTPSSVPFRRIHD